MSNYSPKIYAKVLADIIEEKDSKKSEKSIQNLLDLIRKNGDAKKLKRILVLAEKIYLEKTGNKRITIEIAREMKKRNVSQLFSKKGDVVIEKVNQDLIAGVKITVNDEKQLDLSLSKKLNEIFR